MKKIKKTYIVIVLMIFCMIMSGNAMAVEENSSNIDAKIGFNGLFRHDEITPIKINIKAMKGFKGKVQISFNNRKKDENKDDEMYYENFNKDVVFDKDEITVTMNVPMPANNKSINISLIDENLEVVDKKVIDTKTYIRNNQRVVAVFTDDATKYDYINNIKIDELTDLYFKVVNINDIVIDDIRILDNFDYIIVNEEFEKGIDENGKRDLKLWVEKGGVLLVEKQSKDIINNILEGINLKYSNDNISLFNGNIVLLRDEMSLDQKADYMTEVLRLNINYPRILENDNKGFFDVLLRHVPKSKVPSIRKIILILLIYIIVIGPVNYFTLRLYDKKELVWVTSPIIALVMVGSIFLTSRGSIFDKAVFNNVTFANFTASSEKALMQNETGLIGVSGKNIGIGISDDVDIRLENTLKQDEMFEDERFAVDYNLNDDKSIVLSNSNIWDVTYFSTDEVRDMKPLIVSDLKISNDVIKGTIVNKSDMNFIDCELILGNCKLTLGEMKAKQVIQIDKKIKGNFVNANYYVDDYTVKDRSSDLFNSYVRKSIMNEFNKDNRIDINSKIVAWSSDKMSEGLDIDKKSERIDRNMIITPAKVEVEKGEKVDLSSDILKAKLVESTSLVVDKYGDWRYGAGVCIYELKPNTNIKVEEVNIKLKNEDKREIQYETYLYNYVDKKWDKCDLELVLKGKDIKKYYSLKYGTRVKMHSKVDTSFYIPEYSMKGVGY